MDREAAAVVMKGLVYVELMPMPRPALLAALASDPNTCATAVVTAALFEDIAFAESVIVTASTHADPTPRAAAMTSIGHLARLHKDLATTRRLLVQLERGFCDEAPNVRGHAADAADDIDVFVPSLSDEVSRIRRSAPDFTRAVMKGITILDRDADRGGLAFDLADILDAIGDDAARTLWTCRAVACVGDERANALHEASERSDVLLGSVLLELARGVTQVIDGSFSGERYGEDEPWIRIRAVDGSAFDVESTSPSVLERVRARFEKVRDL